MLVPGSKAPDFNVPACVSIEKGKEFKNVTLKENAGKWVVFYTYPKDFTFVCPTEIVEFDKKLKDFSDRGAVVLGGSTDNEFSHLAWRQSHPDLRDLPFPMLADKKRELCAALGILHEQEGIPVRATFVVDPQGVIRHAAAHDLDVGRSVDEVLRTLDALQTGAMCPAGWRKGQPTLSAP
jgi:peroxiredoxin (alkyl hydroperoxide reductase subunit C)